ncbi:uncharacterized protein LOC111105968 isoform X2 [Crassostrea virginica]
MYKCKISLCKVDNLILANQRIMGDPCSFLTDKNSIGPLCFTSLVIGIISGIGMAICRSRYKHKTYESVNTVTPIRRGYRDLFYHDELDVNDLPGPSQTPEIKPESKKTVPEYSNEQDNYLDPVVSNRSRYSNYLTPLRNIELESKKTVPEYRNEQDNYLDPVVSNRSRYSNYLTPFHNVRDDYLLYENRILGLKCEPKNPKQ